MAKTSRTMRFSNRTWSQLERLAEWLQVGNRTRVIEIMAEQKIVEMEAQKMATAKVETIRGNKTPNGQAMIMRVKVGDKQIGPDVEYWPWSDKSCEQADQIISEIANNNDLELEEW